MDNSQKAKAYCFLVENTSGKEQSVRLFDVNMRAEKNYGNSVETSVTYGPSGIIAFTYLGFLMSLMATSLKVRRIVAYADKSPVSLFYVTGVGLSEGGLTGYKKSTQAPIGDGGYIYPNEKTIIEENVTLGYKEDAEAYILVDRMPANSKLWIELFPAEETPPSGSKILNQS